MGIVILVIQIIFFALSYIKPFTDNQIIMDRYQWFYMFCITSNLLLVALTTYIKKKHGIESNIINTLLTLHVIAILYWAIGVAISDMFQGERIVVYYVTLFFIAYFIHFSIYKIAPIFIIGHTVLVSLLFYLDSWFSGALVVVESSTQVFFFTLLIRYYLDDLYRKNFNQRMEIEEKNKSLEFLCYFDPLSSLLNRRSWETSYHELYNQAIQNNLALSVILFDIDYFKQYNDFYGHVAGDHIIIKVSKVLEEATKDSHGYLGRYGGDEFIFVCMNNCNAEEIIHKIKTKMEILALEHTQSETCSYVTISSGYVTMVPDENQSPWAPVIQADQNMYKMKKNRKSDGIIPIKKGLS
jgi:diguanylate cyclase (GGDEF)-like protein